MCLCASLTSTFSRVYSTSTQNSERNFVYYCRNALLVQYSGYCRVGQLCSYSNEYTDADQSLYDEICNETYKTSNRKGKHIVIVYMNKYLFSFVLSLNTLLNTLCNECRMIEEYFFTFYFLQLLNGQ